jgi:hypothetical protein
MEMAFSSGPNPGSAGNPDCETAGSQTQYQGAIMILERIDKPTMVSKLKNDELNQLAEEIRTRIIEVVAKNGVILLPVWELWILLLLAKCV